MAIPSQSYFFVTGAVPTATQWNSNFVTLVAAFSNIDYTNIGAAGIYASQLKPTSASAATFGGSQTYTFPVGVAMAGPLTGVTSLTMNGALTGVTSFSITGAFEASSNASTLSYVPPLYTATGTAVASTAHMVTGTTSIGTVSSGSFVTVAVTLSGAAVFSSSSSYVVTATLQSMGLGTFAGNIILAAPTSGSSFQITVYAPTGSGITAVTVQWMAIGT